MSQQDQLNPRQMVAKMAQALGIDIDPDAYNAEVVRTGDKIILPDGAILKDVIEVLRKQDEAERQKVSVNTVIPVPPWDGSIALTEAIKEELGFVIAKEQWGQVQEMEVEYELGKTMNIKWGQFVLPGMEDALAKTGVTRDPTTGELSFTVQITTFRRYEKRARKILDRTRELTIGRSIHKGKAFSIQFRDPEGELIMIPTPKFFRFSTGEPIFRLELQNAIERNIFTPLRYAKELQEMGESLKRGVLFAGSYGTGKTMLASSIAHVAVQCGWTFIYVKEPSELPLALKYAQKFQPVVVFVEDVDRIAGLDRTDEVNNLLNQLDGVDSKSAQIMTILTSNHSNQVNKAMRRPGRIDMVLQVLPPDAETIGRMVTQFVGAGLEPGSNLTGIGEALSGFAPAYIREATGRARLEALRRTGNLKSLINGEDLEIVAKEVAAEKKLFADSEPSDNVDLNGLSALANGFQGASELLNHTLNKARTTA